MPKSKKYRENRPIKAMIITNRAMQLYTHQVNNSMSLVKEKLMKRLVWWYLMAEKHVFHRKKPSPNEGYTIVTRRGYQISMKKGKEGIRAKLNEVLNYPCGCNDLA